MDILICAFFALFSLVCLFPFYYIIINTISDNNLVARGRVLFYPIGVHFNNYLEVFQLKGFGRAALISVARTVSGAGLGVLSASFLGYAMTKQEYWHRKFWYRFFIVTMYFNAGLIPYYLTINNLHLRNNFLVYILPSLAAPFNMILVKTYIESIPPALEESAEMDGAGYLARYQKIILPLSKPILATIAIFAAVGQWNSFMDTVMFANKSSLYTLQFIMYKYLNELNQLAQLIRQNPSYASAAAQIQLTPVAVRFTVTAVVVMPVLLIYPFFQRYFVKGIMIGAVKG
jgi:ABC-type glycerol-3-phosphate transport system permease component